LEANQNFRDTALEVAGETRRKEMIQTLTMKSICLWRRIKYMVLHGKLDTTLPLLRCQEGAVIVGARGCAD
jgi:hypothetical protein